MTKYLSNSALQLRRRIHSYVNNNYSIPRKNEEAVHGITACTGVCSLRMQRRSKKYSVISAEP